MKNIAILANPASGTYSIEKKEEILERSAQFLRSFGFCVNSFGLDIRSKKEFKELAEELSKDYNPLVVAGGDGTFFDVLNSQINPDITLGYIPIGTGNALQRVLGIENIDNAITKILQGNIITHDLISYNGDIKCFYAGTGFDSEFTSQLEEIKGEKGIKGWPLHIGSFLKNYPKYTSSKLEISVNGHTIEVENNFVTFVGTIPYIGRGLQVHNGTYPYNGQLAVSTYKSLSQLLSSFISDGRTAKTIQCKRIIARSQTSQHYQCDGELMDSTREAEFSVLRNNIKLIS